MTPSDISQAWPDPRNKRRVRTAPYTKVVLSDVVIGGAQGGAHFLAFTGKGGITVHMQQCYGVYETISCYGCGEDIQEAKLDTTCLVPVLNRWLCGRDLY